MAPAKTKTVRYTRQLLLVRKCPASLTTLPEFAIFSSTGTAPASPKGDNQDWPFSPDAAGDKFQLHQTGKHRCTPLRHAPKHQSTESGAARVAIHARECRSRFSCARGSPAA